MHWWIWLDVSKFTAIKHWLVESGSDRTHRFKLDPTNRTPSANRCYLESVFCSALAMTKNAKGCGSYAVEIEPWVPAKSMVLRNANSSHFSSILLHQILSNQLITQKQIFRLAIKWRWQIYHNWVIFLSWRLQSFLTLTCECHRVR